MPPELYYGESLKKWEEVKEELEGFQEIELKETDVRCKIIDPLLKDVFGWNEQCIIREPKIQAGFIDYYCESGENKFVLEAKSTKVNFKMLRGEKYRLVNSQNLSKTNSDLYDAIEQARSYGKEKNCSFVIASNGLNIIISQTFAGKSDGNDTLLISGAEGITNSFSILYQIMSPYFNGNDAFQRVIRSNNLIRYQPQHTKTLLSEIYDSAAKRGGNEFANPLVPIVSKFFTDIADEESLLKELYCDNYNLDSYGNELKAFVKGRVPMLGLAVGQVAQVAVKNDELGDFGQNMVMKMQDAYAKEGHVFILFGNVGAGKTTFLSRFYHHILKGISKKKLVWINIDFQRFYGQGTDVEEYILKRIQHAINNLEEDTEDFDVLKEIYEKEIARRVKGPWKPYLSRPEELEMKISDYLTDLVERKNDHIEKVIEYLKDQKDFEICLVFDNLDQQSDIVQEAVSKYALTRIDTWRTLIILCLRDETYWNLKKRPPLDAYAKVTSYQIIPPSVEEVLTKRIEYVIKQIGEQSVTFDIVGAQGATVALKMQYKDVFNVFLDTLKTEEAKELFRNLSSGNIRAALEIFRSLTTSQYTNLKNIIDYNVGAAAIYKPIPLDKLIKSIGLGQGAYYNSKNSKIVNMFQNNLYDGFHSHFINFRIIEILKECREIDYKLDTPPGFVPIEEIKRLLSVYCCDEKALRRVLIPLIEQHLVETDIGARQIGDKDYFDKIQCVRITPAGYYYLDELTSIIQYLDLVFFDTMIKNPIIFGKMRENMYKMREAKKNKNFKESWEIRFEYIEQFLNYLKEEEEEEIRMFRDWRITTFGKIMPNIISRYQVQKKIIEERITKPSKKV